MKEEIDCRDAIHRVSLSSRAGLRPADDEEIEEGKDDLKGKEVSCFRIQ